MRASLFSDYDHGSPRLHTCNRISDEVSYPSTARLDYDGAVETPALAFARIAAFSAVSTDPLGGQVTAIWMDTRLSLRLPIKAFCLRAIPWLWS
jgi:hypothetical protein